MESFSPTCRSFPLPYIISAVLSFVFSRLFCVSVPWLCWLPVFHVSLSLWFLYPKTCREEIQTLIASPIPLSDILSLVSAGSWAASTAFLGLHYSAESGLTQRLVCHFLLFFILLCFCFFPWDNKISVTPTPLHLSPLFPRVPMSTRSKFTTAGTVCKTSGGEYASFRQIWWHLIELYTYYTIFLHFIPLFHPLYKLH